MSQLEDKIQSQLQKLDVTVKPQQRMTPIKLWPWKPFPNSQSPKCDFFLPTANIYVEVKGFMTIQAMAKLSWFCRQTKIRYYILQGTEEEWNPYIGSPYCSSPKTTPTSKQKIRERNIEHQVQELAWFANNPTIDVSALSLKRLQNYIHIRIDEYTKWNRKWY